MKLKLLKLITSEEIVAEIVSRDIDNVVVKNPLTIQLVPIEHMGQPQFTVQAIPFIQFSKNTTFVIRDEMILVECDPIDSIEKEYISRFSNITLPTSPEGQNIIKMLRD